MNTINIKMAEKRLYNSPQINCIKLDNEISLTLDSSTAPDDPEASLKAPEYFNSNPFKTNIG